MMRAWRKTFAMDLIRWILLVFDSQRTRQPVTENPRIRMDIPLAMTGVVPLRIRRGGRLPRGPTSRNRRSD
jgi:hypothetical protein